MALSFSIPVGSPVLGSFTIKPPSGLGVSLVIPASLRAYEFARAMCPSNLSMKTGVFGVKSSIISFVGRFFTSQASWSQLPPVIHLPLCVDTYSFNIFSNSVVDFAGRRFIP